MKTSILLSHVVYAAIVTIIMLTIYATVQQTHRSGANDPQLQLARDIVRKINDNTDFGHLLPYDTIEISNSLGTFITLYNGNGEPLVSNGELNGKLPKMPAGVFEFVRAHQEDVLTWQPQKGVRLAMVVEAVKSPQYGFVSVGRSLKEVETRESNLVTMIFIAWLACMSIILIHFVLQSWFNRKQMQTT